MMILVFNSDEPISKELVSRWSGNTTNSTNTIQTTLNSDEPISDELVSRWSGNTTNSTNTTQTTEAQCLTIR
jgi:hypothetical protein